MLSVAQEAWKWPGVRRTSFPPRHNSQRQAGSDHRGHYAGRQVGSKDSSILLHRAGLSGHLEVGGLGAGGEEGERESCCSSWCPHASCLPSEDAGGSPIITRFLLLRTLFSEMHVFCHPGPGPGQQQGGQSPEEGRRQCPEGVVGVQGGRGRGDSCFLSMYVSHPSDQGTRVHNNMNNALS